MRRRSRSRSRSATPDPAIAPRANGTGVASNGHAPEEEPVRRLEHAAIVGTVAPDEAVGNKVDNRVRVQFGRAARPVSVGVAVLRYPFLFSIIVLVVTAAAGAAAIAKTPTSTAEARLLIGKVDAEARAVPGFTQATQQLASIYARVVPTNAVLKPAAAAAKVPLAVAHAEVSGSPIAESSIVRVEVKDTNERRAVRLADAAANALSKYVSTLNNVDPYSTPEYKQYADAANALAQAQVALKTWQDVFDQLNNPLSPQAVLAGPGLGPALENARAQLVAATSQALQAKFRSDQLATAFQNATRGVGDTTPARVIAPAASTGSNRTSNLELGLLVGVVGGVLLAVAVVTLRANVRYLRAFRRSAIEGARGER
jgi:capsular polysaccharide biosynthesis protein